MILSSLRLVAYSYLLIHVWLWWQDFVNPFLFAILIALAVVLPYYIKDKIIVKKELSLYIILLGIIPIIVRLLFIFLEAVFFQNNPILLIILDLSLLPTLVPFYLLLFTSYFFWRNKSFLKQEIFIRLVILFVVFFALSDYKLYFYSNYTLFIISISFYLLIESSIIFYYNHQNYYSNYKNIFNKKFYTKIITMLLVVLLTMLTLPIVFNIISKQMVQYASGLLKPNLDNFDFSQEIKLEDEINLGKDLLLLLQTQPALEKRILFKRYTLAGYNGDKGFYRINGIGDVETIGNQPINFNLQKHVSDTTLIQDFFIINLESTALLGATKIDSVNPYILYDNSKFASAYQVKSFILDTDKAIIAGHGKSLSELERDIYLKQDASEEIKNLTNTIIASAANDLDKVKLINNFFKDNFYYTLKPGQSPTDLSKIEHFLLSERKGYCSYFAFAMTLMTRSLGIPSRVAVGFFAEPKLFKNGYYPITSSEAHAWVEVYLGNLGWVAFDPTSAKMDPSELGNTASSDFSEQIDSLISELNQYKDQLKFNEPKSSKIDLNKLDTNRIAYLEEHAYLIVMSLVSGLFIIIYFAILYNFKKQLTIRNSDDLLTKASKTIKEYYVFYQLVYGKTSFFDFLENNHLLDIYRRLLYSSNFTDSDYDKLKYLVYNYKDIYSNDLNVIKKLFIKYNITQINMLKGVY